MKKLVLLSIPGLRETDIQHLPTLHEMTSSGSVVPLAASFPAVTCSVQSNMTTGLRPNGHGIVANGLYLHEGLPEPRRSLLPPTVSDTEQSDPCNVFPVWPKTERLPYSELWTMPNSAVDAPQIWETLHEKSGPDGTPLRSAVWFALMSKFCSADNICNFAPIHHPDGSESLWCYTRPYRFYGELRDEFGHFPVKHYWGPLAGLPASKWIADTAVAGAKRFQPDFFFVYLPRLDYTPQKFGPDAPQLADDLQELDGLLAELRRGFSEAYGEEPTWLVAGEYAMTAVDSVVYPNRILRELGLLGIEERDGREYLDVKKSKAFALCDHQISHLFFNDFDSQLIEKVARRFRIETGVDEVLVGEDDLAKYDLDHPRSGQIVLVSKPCSWFAYYFWEDDVKAPDYAGTVDIHRKPGYDPVEMFFNRETMSVPLDATLIKGSHGAPVRDALQKTILASSDASLLAGKKIFDDIDVYGIIERFFF